MTPWSIDLGHKFVLKHVYKATQIYLSKIKGQLAFKLQSVIFIVPTFKAYEDDICGILLNVFI